MMFLRVMFERVARPLLDDLVGELALEVLVVLVADVGIERHDVPGVVAWPCRAAPASDRCTLSGPAPNCTISGTRPATTSACAAIRSSMVSAPRLHFSVRWMFGSNALGVQPHRLVAARDAGRRSSTWCTGNRRSSSGTPPEAARGRSGSRRSGARRACVATNCLRPHRAAVASARCRSPCRPRSRCGRCRPAAAKRPPAAMKVSISPRARLNEPPWQSW